MKVLLKLFFLSIISLHDSCIRARNIEQIYVQKGIVNYTRGSTTLPMGPMRNSSLRNVARFSHLHESNVDLGLVKLDWTFAEERYKRSIFFNILEKRMKNFRYTSTEKTNTDLFESYTEKQYQMYYSPIKMFIATVILPSASFMVFFLFIVFYTGIPDSTNILYRTLNDDKKKDQVQLMLNSSPSKL